jgi:transcriptional regulator EpsA
MRVGAAAPWAADGQERLAQRLLHAIEAAAEVHRRGQFYLWLRQALEGLLAHDLVVGGAWLRSRRELLFDGFPAVVLPTSVQSAFGLADAGAAAAPGAAVPASALLAELQRQWVLRGGRAAVIETASLRAAVPEPDLAALAAAGFDTLLVHGVARPQRPNEIETWFALARAARPWGADERALLELLLPTLHSTYLRMQNQERALGATPGNAAAPAPARGRLVTERERQILRWVREGKRNQEIAELLDISALTVKNHIQKILRKLGAANRAQAVALAMSRHLL